MNQDTSIIPKRKPLLRENSLEELNAIVDEQVIYESAKFFRTFKHISSVYDIVDLRQESYIAALRAVKDFREELGSFRTFCRNCIKHHLINVLNSQTCMSRNERDNVAGVLEEDFDPTDKFARGFVLPISASSLVHKHNPEDTFEKEEVLLKLRDKLDAEELRVLDTFLSPPDEVYQLALNTHKRKKALKAVGVNCRGSESVRLTQKHLACYLGYSFKGLERRLEKIRSVAEQIQADTNYISRTPILTIAQVTFAVRRTPVLYVAPKSSHMELMFQR